MADMVTKQELEAVKVDVKHAGEAVNAKKVITPRYGNAFKSIPLLSEELQQILNNKDLEANQKLQALQDAINTALAAGAGAAGWIDNLISTSNGRTQREKNEDSLNLLDFFTEAELGAYKLNPQDVDIKEAFDRAVFAANYLNRQLYAHGTFYSSEALKLYCNCDLSCMTLNSSCATIALEVASNDYTPLVGKTFRTPIVRCITKSDTGWDNSGDTGIRFTNLDSCELTINLVANFKIGLNAHSTGAKGCCYNSVYIKYLRNNKINLMISADRDGSWTNENKFFGGRLSHLSAEGVNISGCRHIFIKASHYVPNQNIFFSPSIEGNAPEYHVENQGCWNAIYSARWEASPAKVLYSVDPTANGYEYSLANQGTKNLICHGYRVDDIKVTHSGDGSAKANRIIGSDRDIKNVSNNHDGGSRIRNSSSDEAVFETVFGVASSVITENLEEYMQQRSARFLRGKRTTDVYPRIELDFVLGEIRLSNGLTDATNAAIIKPISTNQLSINKHLRPGASGLNIGVVEAPWGAVYTTKVMYTATVGDFCGSGSPEGNLTAGVGSTYRRADGVESATFYVKESGTGNTGWVAK